MNYKCFLVINHFQVTAPCNISLLNDYTYTLLQRNYCQLPLISSEINVILDDTDDTTPNTQIPAIANVQSLILNSTWSISVQVSNRFGNDTTAYTDITDTGNDINNIANHLLFFTGIKQNCDSSSVTHLSSSTILLTSTSMHSSTSLSVPLFLPSLACLSCFYFLAVTLSATASLNPTHSFSSPTTVSPTNTGNTDTISL